jgi:SHS2 domain-containing protein/predicted Zn-ribbon and HTH transcriptional regulator
VRRRDLIPLLLDQPRTLTQLAREVRSTPRDLAGDLAHLLRSLAHTEFAAEITPARCRKCGFTFDPDKLLKPAKCPQCRGTWIAEPRIALRRRTASEAGGGSASGPATGEFAPADSPPWLTPLDHTADTGIIVTAPDLPTLFSRAAWGMFSVITDLAAVQPAASETVEVGADDLPGLLVRWLSELNFRHITTHRLYARFEVLELGANASVGAGSAPAPGAVAGAPPATPSDSAAPCQMVCSSVNRPTVHPAADVTVRAPPGGPWRLRAEVFGEPIVPGRHIVFTEIKAVTFHGLELAEVDGGWRAQIIFDL